VQAFLDEEIPYKDISEIIRTAMHNHDTQPVTCIEDVLEADRWVREETRKLITVTL
jgi:1-deoxy-D-xylulose-5-phosphate reductoisomerase